MSRRPTDHEPPTLFAASIPLFVSGCLAGLLLFPHMVELLASFTTGVAFVPPVFLGMLDLRGVVPAG